MTTEPASRKWGITSFGLHMIAMGLMLCDHLWGTLPGDLSWLGYLGRGAFPVFAFLTAEGFFHTGNRKKYALRLLIFALISEIPFNLIMEHRLLNPIHQNVLWTFLLCIGVMSLYEKIRLRKTLLVRLVLYAAVTLGGYLAGFVAFVDYYGYGVLTVALFYFTGRLSAEKHWQRLLLRLLQLAGLYWINCEMMKGMMIPITLFGREFEVYKQGFALLSLPLIWLYSGRQGPYNKHIRRLYYWFYPVHMLLLGLLITLL